MKKADLRVAIRVDASSQIGLGHVKRCLSLAQSLQKTGTKVCVVSRELGVDTASLAKAVGADFFSLPSPTADSHSIENEAPHASWSGVPWSHDVGDTVACLQEWRADWVVVDHYAFDEKWHRRIAAALRARIAVIDDLADRRLAADLLIDHNLAANHKTKYEGCLSQATPILGGPRFALLAPAYSGASRYLFNEKVRSIGIFMGGVDSIDMSSFVLRACRTHAAFTGPIEIATTTANPHLDALRELCAKWPETTVTVDAPDLISFFLRHDLQVGAGGGATWERCCLGVPTLAVKIAQNQEAVIPALKKIGVLQEAPGNDAVALGTAIRSLIDNIDERLKLSLSAQSLVDGRGAERVALAIAADHVQFRPVGMGDAELMLRWRNHPATRGVSRDSSIIEKANHLAWLQKTLGREDVHIWIAYIGSLDFGVTRFDRRDFSSFEVSLYLDPDLHGFGLGKSLLLGAESMLPAAPGRTLEIRAEVMPGNVASQKLFEACGYSGDKRHYIKQLQSQ